MIPILLLGISFLLESSLSLIIPIHNTIFQSCFLVIALLLCAPYIKDKKKYYFICFIYGFLCDVILTDTLFFYAIIYLVLGHFICLLFQYLIYQPRNIVLASIGSISLYRVVTYLSLVLIDYMPFDWHQLAISIYTSYLSNLLYVGVWIMVITLLQKRHLLWKYPIKGIFS